MRSAGCHLVTSKADVYCLWSSAPVSPSICIHHYITVVPTYGHGTLTQFEVPPGFVPCLPDQLHSLPLRSIRKSCRALSLHAPALPLLPLIMPELQHHSLVLWYLNNLLFIYLLFLERGGLFQQYLHHAETYVKTDLGQSRPFVWKQYQARCTWDDRSPSSPS